MATRALNSGLCFLRFCFNFLLLFILFILGAELYLNNLSSFWGPPQWSEESTAAKEMHDREQHRQANTDNLNEKGV
jgi:hypothetical protein